ncbi:MAG TPA: adenylate/guanylate cyclase domain-containing protein [Bacteroidota bacterium]|nr:adenylate/guanylate cyclase domain-containing protein [Bacteroidota bacterium]
MPSKESKRLRSLLLSLSISIAVSVFILLLTQDVFFEITPLKRAELSLLDLRFQERGLHPLIRDSSQVIIVEISQETFKSLPEKWPWPRSYYARLIRNLKRAGAKAVGIDIVFSSNDTRDPKNDDDFRKALKETGIVVLGGRFDIEENLYTVRSRTENYGNVYIDSTTNAGLVNARSDVDGVLRRYIPFAYDPAQDKRIPMFSLAILNVYFNQPSDYTVEVLDKYFEFVDRKIPRSDPTSFLVNYYGPSGTFRRMKFGDILDDQEFKTVEELELGEDINTFDDPDIGYLYDGTFKDKIVLVGSTMPEDKDLFHVPIAEGRQAGDNQMYGVEIHGNVIQNVLDNYFLTPQPLAVTALIVFIISFLTFVFVERLKTIKAKNSIIIGLISIVTVLSTMLIFFWLSVKVFIEFNYIADMTSPLLAVILSFIAGTIYNFLTERKQKVLIKGMFSQYVNPSVVDEIVSNPEKLRLGGERKELTVFFNDIENFTRISEKIPPEELVAILNEYLSAMTAILFANNGTLDKYEGDAIMAFWGAPIPQPDHALRACRTAVEMQDALGILRQTWQKEGKPKLNVRFGLNTGEVIVGNMGGVGRFDYTVIGDAVNLGARLESANKQYKTNIMISESTYKYVADQVIARELDLIVVAGKTEPIRVYELIGLVDGVIADERMKFLEHYTTGLKFYRAREWNKAIEKFQMALEIVPEDYPAQIYIERAYLYIDSPPPPEWNGVFILRTK